MSVQVSHDNALRAAITAWCKPKSPDAEAKMRAAMAAFLREVKPSDQMVFNGAQAISDHTYKREANAAFTAMARQLAAELDKAGP